MKRLALCAVVACLVVSWPVMSAAQGRGAAPATPQTAKAKAPIDLTGYWVSIVSEDWRYRMVTPTKGDYQGVPMNPEARKVADAWDPDADQNAGQACKSYGAPAILRVPGRLHITWQDDQTLKLDTDAGTQTRLFRFEPGTGEKPAASWQGDSDAKWEALVAGTQGAVAPKSGWLKVTTKNLRPGYLRKNGVPYSEAATLTEYFDLGTLPSGDRVIVVTSVLDDPKYLTQPFIVSTQFKQQPSASGWEPTPCSTSW
jgi:hypothetical protein